MKVGLTTNHSIPWIETLDEFPQYIIVHSPKKGGITRVYKKLDNEQF